MHVGLSLIFQGSATRADHEVYADELKLARLAEPLGFDSVWTVEHHFTSYTMVPDPLQFLTYMAGCTERVQLGTMVVVLPWHDPVRVAEGVAMLDNLSGGRVILGIGRGLGRVEFGGFGVSMDESRARFVESARIVLEGLEKGRVQHEGTYYQQAPRDLRPAPFKSFRDRTYASAVSPESVRIMADLARRHHDRAAEAVGAGRSPSSRSTATSTARRAAPSRRRRRARDGCSATPTRSGRASSVSSTSAATTRP